MFLIVLGNVSIHDLNLKWLRSQISLVSQDPTLFSTTVFENIVYGLDESGATLSAAELKTRVEDAAITANAHEFISNLPNGYHTEVGEKGMQLSGGQRQRICIARAVIKNPAILLLDEATSALDVEAERAVQRGLTAASKGRTTIIVAHRLSTIRNADNIVVMSEGRIVEQGTHDALVAQQSFYATLVGKQQSSQQSNEIKVAPSKCALEIATSVYSEKDTASRSADLSLKDEKSPEGPAALPAKPTTKKNDSGFTWRTLFSALRFIIGLNKPEALVMITATSLAIVAGLAVPA